jgi:hypothetical protein
MILRAYFHHAGTPRVGLAPQIWLYNLTESTNPVAGAVMTEVGNGWYKYEYAGDETDTYVYTVDSVLLSGLERYGSGDYGGDPGNVRYVNGVRLTGVGVSANPWRPV